MKVKRKKLKASKQRAKDILRYPVRNRTKLSQSKQPDKEMAMYPVRKRIVGIAGISLFFMLLCLAMLIEKFFHRDIYSFEFITLLLAVAFSCFCFLYFLKRRLSSTPSIVINSEGIVDNSTAFGAGMIKWGDIEGVSHYNYEGQPYLEIIPRDKKAFLQKQPPISRFIMRANSFIHGPLILIPVVTLPMSVKEIESTIVKYRNSRS
jgi:hypothetical protein